MKYLRVLIVAALLLMLGVLVAGCGGSGTGNVVTPQAAGAKIAFDSDRTGGFYHIFVMGPNGGGLTDLNASGAGATCGNAYPSWSPDHRRLVFTSNRTGHFEVYLMDFAGLNVKRVTFNASLSGGIYEHPAWSPDGTKIVASRYESDGSSHLYLFHPDGTHFLQLTTGTGMDYSPTWLPDSTGVVFASNRKNGYQIWAINNKGLNLHRLTLNGGNLNSDPACAADVQRIVFNSARSGNWLLWTMKLDGTDPRVVPNTDQTYSSSHPSWGPAGTSITFDAASVDAGVHHVFKINTDGSSLQPITDFTKTSEDENPVWGRIAG